MLAENVEGIANATETVEMLNQAQENLQEVAKNPGIVGTWLQGLIPDLLNFAFQVVVAIIIYIVGSKIIGLILKMFRKSMERRDVDTGVRQFVQLRNSLKSKVVAADWQLNKKVLGSRRSLATVFWSLSTVASDTQRKRTFVLAANLSQMLETGVEFRSCKMNINNERRKRCRIILMTS